MSGETTAVKQRCAKCGLEIDSFAANPGMWPIWASAAGDNGATRLYHQQCVIQTDELERLRADNARLKSERDEANLFRERNRIALNRRDADLQAHKTALEKARVALELFVTTWKLAHPIQRLLVFEECAKDCSDALATINELLQKGSK